MSQRFPRWRQWLGCAGEDLDSPVSHTLCLAGFCVEEFRPVGIYPTVGQRAVLEVRGGDLAVQTREMSCITKQGPQVREAQECRGHS